MLNLIAIYHRTLQVKIIEKYRTQNCYDLELNFQTKHRQTVLLFRVAHTVVRMYTLQRLLNIYVTFMFSTIFYRLYVEMLHVRCKLYMYRIHHRVFHYKLLLCMESCLYRIQMWKMQ